MESNVSIKKEVGLDLLIDILIEEFYAKTKLTPKYLILNTLGAMILKELLVLEHTMELPNSYKGLIILHNFSEGGEIAEVL